MANNYSYKDNIKMLSEKKKIGNWKKAKGYENDYSWLNLEIKKAIQITKINQNEFLLDLYLKKETYIVTITNLEPLRLIIRKGFKTKQEALKFARAYMRTH